MCIGCCSGKDLAEYAASRRENTPNSEVAKRTRQAAIAAIHQSAAVSTTAHYPEAAGVGNFESGIISGAASSADRRHEIDSLEHAAAGVGGPEHVVISGAASSAAASSIPAVVDAHLRKSSMARDMNALSEDSKNLFKAFVKLLDAPSYDEFLREIGVCSVAITDFPFTELADTIYAEIECSREDLKNQFGTEEFKTALRKTLFSKCEEWARDHEGLTLVESSLATRDKMVKDPLLWFVAANLQLATKNTTPLPETLHYTIKDVNKLDLNQPENLKRTANLLSELHSPLQNLLYAIKDYESTNKDLRGVLEAVTTPQMARLFPSFSFFTPVISTFAKGLCISEENGKRIFAFPQYRELLKEIIENNIDNLFEKCFAITESDFNEWLNEAYALKVKTITKDASISSEIEPDEKKWGEAHRYDTRIELKELLQLIFERIISNERESH